MLLKYHLKEIKYRFIYLIISLLITYIIIFSFNNYILLMFSPNIKTFMMYSNIIDGILLKWTVSLYLTILFIFPYVIFSLWSFIRPGLFKKEDINIKLIPLIWLMPLFIYFFIISVYNYYLIEFIMEGDGSSSIMERFLPSLFQIVILIKNIITFSLFVTILFIMSIYLNVINIEIYKKYRLHIIFIFLLLLTFFLPPDILVLSITTIVTIIVFEIILFINLIIKNYLSNIIT